MKLGIRTIWLAVCLCSEPRSCSSRKSLSGRLCGVSLHGYRPVTAASLSGSIPKTPASEILLSLDEFSFY